MPMMPTPLLVATIVIYFIASSLLFLFGANLVLFASRSWRRKRKIAPASATVRPGDEPMVTVQLPIYNELYVSRRIIEAACALDWPSHRLEIQVLDDSTDETRLVVADAVASARARGINIVHLHRTDRTGYKAGALAAGLQRSNGEFVAIFDADFVPSADFLRRTIPHFVGPNIAFVQCRWGHLNRDYSWLTRLQALALDAHFLLDQANRGSSGYWFNFNGTAGVWRAVAIEDAGGWRADTLTEDLDLSYRAHLRGWRASFLEDLVVPAELPVDVTGFRRQQHRWARGSIECAFRLLPQVWRAKAPLSTRYQATIHLTSYGTQLLLMVLVLIYPPLTLAAINIPESSTLYGFGYVFGALAIAPTLFFVTGRARAGSGWVRDLPRVMLLSVFGSGLMLNTARAALQIATHPKPEFERTAKFGLEDSLDQASWTRKRYQLEIDRIVFAEIALAAYGYFATYYAFVNGKWGIALYASIFSTGLAMVAMASISHAASVRRHRWARDRAVGNERSALSARFRKNGTMETTRRAMIVMAKRPAAGVTKTRLSPALSMQQAADLYERFLRDTLDAVAQRTDCDLVIAIDHEDAADWFEAFAPGVAQVTQVGESLGDRLDAVMSTCLEHGYDQVFAISSDSPDLPATHLTAAVNALDTDDVDVVFGPTDDGGYYLIGWKQRWSRLVTEITMSTPTVLADSLGLADDLGARVALAPGWYDIDQPADLDRLRESLAEDGSHTADFLAAL